MFKLPGDPVQRLLSIEEFRSEKFNEDRIRELSDEIGKIRADFFRAGSGVVGSGPHASRIAEA